MDPQEFEGGQHVSKLSDVEKYAKTLLKEMLTPSKFAQVKLDDVDLIKRVDKGGKTEEIRSIYDLSVYGGRSIVELPIPGSVGNVFQDMGRAPLRISFKGLLVGPGAPDTLKDIKTKFEMGKPVPFSSDIVLISDITAVIIEEFTVNFVGGVILGFRYSMVLKEHTSASTTKKSGQSEKEKPGLMEKTKDMAVKEVEKKAKQALLKKLGD
jgi:hypothetical protein